MSNQNKDFDPKYFDALMAVLTDQRNEALNQVVLASASSKRFAERVQELEQEAAALRSEILNLRTAESLQAQEKA